MSLLCFPCLNILFLLHNYLLEAELIDLPNNNNRKLKRVATATTAILVFPSSYHVSIRAEIN